MDPHPCLVELAEAGSASLRAGLINVPSHERDFLEAWWHVPSSLPPPPPLKPTHLHYSRDTLSNYASSANTPALSRTPSSLLGMISTASASAAGVGSPPLDVLVMSPGPNGGHKELMRSIPLDAVLYELELLIDECKSSSRPLSDLLDRPSTPLSFHTISSSSGTISSIATPTSSSFFQPYSGEGLSPMQQLIAQGPVRKSASVKSVGRARAGSFAVRGVI